MSKKVLFVEDEEFIRDMYAFALKKAGYDLDFSPNGQDALDKIKQAKQPYDLIISDIMLPKVDGLNLLKKIRSSDSKSQNTPFFLLTNLGPNEETNEALNQGANKYMLKINYKPKDVVAEVDKFFKQNN